MTGIEDVKDTLKRPKVYRSLLLISGVAVAALLFTSYIVTAALVVGVGVVAWTMNRLSMKQIGIELATLSTVLIAVAYGPMVGAGMGFALIILLVTAGQYTGSYIIWVIPSYAVAGFIAGSLASMDITVLGIGLTIGMQAVFATLTSVSAAGQLNRYLPFAVTNIIFNLFAFGYLAPRLLPLMT